METLTLERAGSVLRVWLDRPDTRNPLSGTALQELIDVFAGVNTDFDVRYVVLGGRDAEVDSLAARLAAKPDAAVAMTKSQLRAYGAAFRTGDLTELDGDLLLGASRSAEARRAFGGGS